ncbi:MAG: T9SS type A sorting domain-containing protein [Saprospiraceae bacterium]|nr:T9SS type A sorting domain-containing protein [Saprospiraceae bacterium]
MKKMYFCMFFTLTIFTAHNGFSQAQPCSPNCNDLNASILTDAGGLTFHSAIFWTDIISNFACAAPVTYTIFSPAGTPMASGSSDDAGNEMYFQIADPCKYPEGVRVQINNALGACWSHITFKRHVPTIIGRRITVYCDNPIVDDPKVLIGGVPPTAFVPCLGLRTPAFVADWVFPRDCVPSVQDTVKQILREWEFFDKDGNRASAFDTIDVFLFPEITADHIYCAESDTVYCGLPKVGVGPFITYDSLNTGVCDTTYLVLIEDKDKDGMLEFVPDTFDNKCGLAVHVDYEKFNNECDIIYKVNVDIKQNCFGVPQTTCLVTPPAGMPPNMAQFIAPGYWRCTFWVTDLDTVPPVAVCKFDKIDPDRIFWSAILDQVQGQVNPPNTHCFASTQGDPIVIVPTSSHECSGHTYIPPLCIYDDWSGVKQVKASIPGFGSWILTGSTDTCVIYLEDSTKVTGHCYESHAQIKIPKSEEPFRILYEAYDNCHNIDSSYCYLYVKDQTRPVPVLDKGVTVSLGEKKTWVKADVFDEGSWDNCGVNLILARRKDWYEACIDLCDSTQVCCTTEHHDTLRMAFLEPDKDRDPVEAHYAKTLDWLRNDNTPCGNLIYNSWQYALMKHATLKCVEHPYPVNDNYFREKFLECYEDYLYGDVNGTTKYDIDPETPVEYCLDRWGHIDPYFSPGCEPHVSGSDDGLRGLGDGELIQKERELIAIYEALGGGWAEDVMFSCEDACGPVVVEVLVMDYWCNWSVAWTNVWVEDRVPAEVAKDVIDQSITCKTYKDNRYQYADELHPVSIEYIVEQAKEGEVVAYAALDSIFGGYEKAWIDPYGNYVDINGEEIDCDIIFYDSVCKCTSDTVKYRVYDEHLGYIWKDSLISDCYYYQDTSIFQKGIVAVNCDQNVYCEQTVWCDIDHCGEGYIYRKFKIWQSCVDTFYSSHYVPDSIKHPVDTIYRHQRIYVGNECDLNKYMFDVPGDTDVYSCTIDYDPNGSGNVVGDAGPENTGYATYKFDDGCRLVGIAHEDKVFKIVGGEEACYKIIRTWYFADWCGTGGEPLDGKWWSNDDFVLDYCTQKILVYDTTAPVCVIEGSIENGGSLEVGSCDYDLNVTVTAEDLCGLTGYQWELKNIDDPGEHYLIEVGSGDLDGDATTFDITVEDLPHGSYKLKVQVADECNNESYCEYLFTTISVKKPTPVCVTSLTADIIPWDTDQDGVADSAHAVVWAYEFDRSSLAPCGSSQDSLSFYVQFIDDQTSGTLDMDEVLDSLEVTCAHIGTKMVRLWVVDNYGAADYCDVLLVVQNNAGACDVVTGQPGSIVGSITDENDNTVELVQVMAESNQALSSISSGTDGTFQFDAPMGAIVTLTPFKNVNPKNGITTMDLIEMTNHVTGSKRLPTAYRRLAADINRDKFINALDLLELRQLILGEIEKLPSSDSWRFVTKDYIFTTEAPESENVKESMEINLDQPRIQGDFVGMKMGDLDMDNDPANRAPRSGENLVFTTADMILEPGGFYEIPIKSTSFQAVAGYQYTLEIDEKSASIVDFKVGSKLAFLDESNFGKLYLSDGLLTTSWNATSDGLSVDWGSTIYSVLIRAKQRVHLSDIMTISGRVTDAESYQQGKVKSVSLSYDYLDLGEEIILYQNVPNPAREFTNIDFYLPSNSEVKLIVNDISGKTIKLIKGVYGAGKHSIEFNINDLPSAQVYFYTLVADQHVLTKKMVFLR